MSIYRRGRIALNGWANCNSPLHVCYQDIGKYTYKSCKYTKKTSWAWYEGICVCRRGELKFAHIANSPTLYFEHITNSPTLQIHLCFQLPLMGGRIALNGWANCNSPMLQFIHIANLSHIAIRPYYEFTHVDRRIAIRPYTCIFWMLANIHVIKYKYTCKYLNTCKLMIERIYIPT